MKKVIIFGASGYGKKALYSLDEKEYETIAFIDNHKELQGEKFNGIMIESPTEISKYNYDYIIISKAIYDQEMRKQLLELGVDEKKIISFQPNYSQIDWQETRYAMLRICIEQIINKKVPGNMAELGVYKGDFAQYLNRYLPDKKLYLFDTFEGFHETEIQKNDRVIINSMRNFKDTCTEEVLSKMIYRDNVITKKGYFPDTVKDVEDRFCFVSLDADLYSPILNGLEYFYPRLEHGGYIFVHDFGTLYWRGCTEAVNEYCTRNNISYVPILDSCLSIVITK